MQLDRILIVDEDQSVRRVIKETLGKSYDILEAKHGFEAVRIADSLKPALIILDLKTPGLSGTDVCRRLKETKHTRNIPVILTASHFNKVEIVAGLKAGADDYLTKPINPGDVLVRVETHLRYRNFYEGLEPRDLQLLLELSDSISVLRNPMKILRQVVDKVAEIINVDRCSIVGINENNEFTVKASNDSDLQDEIKLDLDRYPEIRKAHDTRSAVIVNKTTEDPLMEPVRTQMQERGLNSIFVVPIIKKESVIGTLFLGTATKLQDGVSERAYKLCHLVANISANALENAILFESMSTVKEVFEEGILRDSLTRLYTHRHFYDQLEKEASRTLRYKTPLSLILFDIDDFRKTNDSYGHMRGDEVLKQIGRIVRDVIRDADVAARYGGEEFSILLPNTGKEGAMKLAERIGSIISEFKYDGIEQQKITVSTGLLTYGGDSKKSSGELVELAEKAMNKAKKAGKNRVVALKDL